MTRHWFRKRDGRPRAAGTLFDDAVVMLEERVMLDAVPSVTIVGAEGGTGTAATQHVLLKSPSGNFSATLEFANTSGDNTVGFGPYIELIVPKVGADGVATGHADDDGITFSSATYLGLPVTAVVNTTFDVAGHATNTLTGDVVNGTPGNQFVVLQLPFGSYTPPQTPADIVANFTLSDHADLGFGLAIQARGGFEFGHSATGNPMTDHIVNPTFGTSDTITPTLMTVTKASNAPNDKEEEVGTGPNQPLTYTISVDVADGQTLTNIDITDLLPASAHYLSATVTSGGGTVTLTPTATANDVGVDTTAGHNTLTAHFNSVTGTSSTADAQIQVSFYVAKTTFAGAAVIDPATGATTVTTNQASATATWHPIDPIDSDTTFSIMSNVDTIQNQPIVIQKTVADITHPSPATPSPGDTLEYTLNIQVSDYFTIGDLTLNDMLGDGQRLDTTFIPTLTVIERGIAQPVGPAGQTSGAMAGVTVGGVAAGDVTSGNEFTGTFASAFSKVTGVTTSTIDISTALMMAAAAAPGGSASPLLGLPGVLSGGRVQGTAAGTTLVVKFRAVVQNNFESDAISAVNRAVDQGDTVGNNVILNSSIRNNTTGAPLGGNPMVTDDGDASVVIAKGNLTKSIYAINGSTTLPVVAGQVQIKAGDEITYRLEYDLPISSFQNLFFNDFLPLPVLVAQGLTLTTPATPATAPADGLFSYGPNDTFHTVTGHTTPTESPDAAGNSVKFTYPDYSFQNAVAPPNTVSHVDLLFTLTVKDTPFADGLFLTNLATSNESNTLGNALNTNGIVQIQLAQPKLLIQKAIVSASENGGAKGTIAATPATPAVPGLTFGLAGSATGPTIGTTLTDTTLGLMQPKDTVAAPNINSNVTGLDAGDIARVALVINNEGGSDAFDVTFGDMLAAGTTFAGGTIGNAASHLVVTRGDAGSTPLVLGVDYTISASTATSFQITLTNNFGANGAGIGKDSVSGDGSDILLVTYDIALANSVAITPTALTSSADIPTFRALPVATNPLAVNQSTDPMDAATIGLGLPAALKEFVLGTSTSASTAEPATTTGNVTLTIGEQATYKVTYTLPEGTLSGVKLSDILPGSAANGRYEIVSATITSVGTHLTTTLTAGDTGALSSTNGIAAIKDTATFGGAGGVTIVNANDNMATDDDQIVVTYVVRAVDPPGNTTDNTNGDSGFNTGRLTYSGTNVDSTTPISIALPDVNIDKVLTTTPSDKIDAGDLVTFTITVNHVGGTINAYDVNISDVLPSGLSNLTYVMGSVVNTGGLALTDGDFTVTGGNTLSLTTPIAVLTGTQSFTITVTATVDNNVPAGSTITNNAGVVYSTLAGAVAGERTINESDPAIVPIAPTAITKTINTTSVGNDSSSTVVIGETITFDLTTTLSEGDTNTFKITDNMPAGLIFVSGMVYSIGGDTADIAGNIGHTSGGNITNSSLAIGDTITFPTAPVFTFGNVHDLVDNTAQTGLDKIVVRVTARVADIPGTVNGTQLGNVGVASEVVGGSTIMQSSTSTVTVAVPDLVITKARVGSGNPDAGDTVTYTVDVRNNSTTGAFDLALNDPLPAGLTGLTVTSLSTNVGGLMTANFATTGNTLSLTGGAINMGVGQFFTVTITATVADTAFTGSTITNKADISFSTLSGSDPNERVVNSGFLELGTQHTSSVSLTDSTAQLLAKTITASTDPFTGNGQFRAGVTDLGLGETGTFRITVTLAEGTTNNVVISDDLVNGASTLAYIGGTATVSIGGAAAFAVTPTFAGGKIIFSLGNVVLTGDNDTTNNTVVITYNAKVDESVGGNVAGNQPTLTATLSSTNHGNLTAGVGIDIVAPIIGLTKASGGGTHDAGDVLGYTITIANTGTGPAHDMTLADVLPSGLVTTGTTTLTIGASVSSFATPNAVTISTLDIGQTATVTYNVLVQDSAVTGATLTNTATTSFDTLIGAGGRAGTASNTANITLASAQTLTKAITATSVAATGSVQVDPTSPDLLVGETATFQIVATLPEGTTNSVVITDVLQNALGRLTLTGTPVITLGNGITFTGAGTFVAGADVNGDGLPDSYSFNFGNVTVPGDNIAGNNTITITYTALLPDVAANVAGNHAVPAATLTDALPSSPLSASAAYDIVQPNVIITKTVDNATTAASGDIVTYTATLANTTGSTADAQDVVFTDLLGSGANFVGGTVLVNGVATAVTPSGSGFTLHLPTIALGATTTVVYQANVNAAASSTVTTTAQVDYDGIPSGGGVSGTDGQADRDQSHSASASLGTIGITKAITATSVPETGTAQVRAGVQDLAIGETATFQLTINVPAGNGQARTFSVGDLLDLAGVGRLTLVGGVGGVSIVPAGVSFASAPVMTTPDLDADGNPDLNIAFSMAAGSGAGTITITYVATAANVVGNASGDQIDLPATLTYNAVPPAGIAGTLGASASVDIVEPVLAITKDVATSGTPNAGDTVTYTVVVTNSGNGPAYDVAITDPLPSNLTYTGTPTLTLSLGGGTTNPASAAAVNVSTLLPGQSATLTYSAIVGNAVVVGSTVTNTATVNSDSLPGAPVGRAGPTLSDPASFVTEATQALAKTIFATDNPDTTAAAINPANPDLTIGEAVTFDLRVDLSEGSTTSVVLSDALTTAAGTLTYVPGSATVATANGATFTGSITPTLVDDNADGVPDRVVFTLGTVTIPGDNVAGNNFLVIRYQAIAANRPENASGDTLDLTATLTSTLGTLTSARSVDIVEPVLSITKDVSAGTPNAGDTVTYTVVVTNTGNGPAYDVAISDPLPAGLTYTGVATLNVAGVVANPASTAAVTIPALQVGQTATLTYSAIVGNGIVTGATVTNIATLNSDSVPGAPTGRAGPTITDPASFTTEATQTFAKTISATDNPDTGTTAFRAGVSDLNIGEGATFDLRVGFSEGSTTGVVVSDFLTSAAGTLTYLPGSAVLATANGVTLTGSIVPTLVDDNADGVPDRIVFTLGTVTVPGDNVAGNNFFVIRYTAVPTDRPENQAGDAIDLTATLTSALGTLTDAKGIDIVAPLLGIDKSVVTVGTPNAGDTVTYTIVITNNGTGPAYNALIGDPLPAGLTYVPGTATLDGVAIGGSPASVTVPALLVGQSATLSYQALIGNTAVTGSPLVNTATLDGDTVPGAPVGRATPQVTDSASFIVEALQGLDKAISATSDANTGAAAFRPGVTDLHVGEAANFDLTVRLTEGTTGTVVLTDSLLTAIGTLTLVGTPTIVTANGITFTGPGTAGFTLVDANADGVPEAIRFDFGTVTVPGDNNAANNFFIVRYTAVVGDRPENQAGDALDLAATLTSAVGTSSASASADVVAPSIVLSKAANAGFVSRGDTVGYTISLMNSGTGPAYDLALADMLPSGLSYVAGSTTLTAGGTTTSFTSPNAVTLAMLGSGQTATVTYQVRVDPNVAASASYTNTASVGFDSLSGPGGRTGTASGMATITTPTNVLGLSKSIVTTSIPETGTAMFRPGVTDLGIGERATIDLTASFTEGTTATVVLTDQLPLTGRFQLTGTPTITFLGGITTSSPGTATLVDTDGDGLADKITFNFGTVTVPVDGDPTNNLIRIRYDIIIPDVASNPPGAALTSPALLTSAAGNVAASITTDIVAPNVTIAKAVPAGTADAGDVKTYTVTLNNTGSGPAFDLTLADALPTGLTAVSGTTVLTVGGTATNFASPASVPIASLGVGQAAVLTFNATVGDGVVGGSTLTNGASISYDSAPGVGGHPDSASSTASFTTAAVQTLDKSIVATSEPLTGTAAVRPGITDLTIGETATIQLATTFNEGTTNNVVITDQLVTASGVLTFKGTPTLTLGAGVTVSGSVTPQFVDTNGDGVADQVRFVLGTVVIPGDNNPANNIITIRYDAVLADTTVNASGNQFTVAATLTSSIGTMTDGESADIVAPLVTIAKAVPGAVADAGDVKSYTVTVTNSGIGPAFDLTIADPLPAGLTAVAGSTVLTAGGVSTNFASPGAVTLASLNAGQTAIVTFQARIDDSVVGGSTLLNTATVSYDSVGGAGGHTGTASANASFVTAAVQTLDKSIVATSEPLTGTAAVRPGITDLTIGETATIQLATTFNEGTTTNVVITDQLVTASGVLTFKGTPTLTLGAGVTVSGSVTPQLVDTNGDGVPDQVRFVLGTVVVPGDNNPANNIVTIRYDAVLADTTVNASGNQFTVAATLTSSIGTMTDGESADIVAPLVTIAKAVPGAVADAGDVKSYTVTVTNSGIGPAFDLTIADPLPAGLTAVAGSTVLTAGGVSTSFASPGAVTLASLNAGQTAIVTFQARVDDSVVGGSTLTNTATVSYDSVGGPGGHTGTASANASFTTAAVQTLDKSIVSTTESFTGTQFVRPGATDLTIGETATFELATTFSEGTTTNVVITDQLVTAGGVLTFTGTPTLILGAGITISGSVTPQLVDTNGDGVPDQVRFVLGSVTVPGDNNPANNFVRIRYDAVLANTPANVAGGQLNLPATLTSSSGSLTDSEPADIVAPVLAIEKVLAPTQPTDGLTTVFLITVHHTAASTAAATNLTLTEVLPSGALLAGASIVSAPAGTAINGNVITIPLLGIGETATIQISTSLDFSHPPTGDTINTATAGYGTTTAGPPSGRVVTGVTATAILPFGNPTTTLPGALELQEQNELSSIGYYLDARYVEDFPEIDPIYSGSAAPGTFVTIDVNDETGSASGFGSGIADAGGNWLVRLPSTTVSDRLERSRFEHHYDGSRLFRSPFGNLFDDRSLLGFQAFGDRLSVGSKPAYNTQIVRIGVGGGTGGFDTSFAPAWRDQFFSMESGLSVGGVFRDRAAHAVEGLYEGLASPEAAGLNRFNREFLTTADF